MNILWHSWVYFCPSAVSIGGAGDICEVNTRVFFFNLWPWREKKVVHLEVWELCVRNSMYPGAHIYPQVNRQPRVLEGHMRKRWRSAYRTWESRRCGRGWWQTQVHTDLLDWKNNEVHTWFIPGPFLDASALHSSTTGKDAAACQGRVGHPPLGPLPLSSASEVYSSEERFLPADICSNCKDNTLSFEAELDGCAASPRLMDTHICSDGAADCAWPPAKCRRPVFKHVSTLPLSCT